MLDCLASGQARHRQRYFVGTAATTCGTTWHAAGLIGQLRNSRQMTRWARGAVKGPRLLPRSGWRIVVEFGAPFLRHAGLDKILNEARPDVPSRCRRTREPIPRNLPPCKRALRSVVRFSSSDADNGENVQRRLFFAGATGPGGHALRLAKNRSSSRSSGGTDVKSSAYAAILDIRRDIGSLGLDARYPSCV